MRVGVARHRLLVLDRAARPTTCAARSSPSTGSRSSSCTRPRTTSRCSRIVATLHPGAAVTSYKNIVDKVVTEHGVAELRGRSIRERTERLIAIAHPKFRDELTAKAREFGYI